MVITSSRYRNRLLIQNNFFKWPVLIAATSVAFVGCAGLSRPQQSAPDAALQADLPSQWSTPFPGPNRVDTLASTPAPTYAPTTASPDSLVAWWGHFKDPLLSRLVDDALKANTDIRVAVAALAQVRATRDVRVADAGPQLGLGGSAQRSQAGSNDAQSNFSAKLDASWEPDFFGANRGSVDAASAQVLASESSLGAIRVAVSAEVALAYITLRANQSKLVLTQSNLAAQEELLQLARWRLQAGLVSGLDVEQALAAVLQTRAQVPVLQAGILQGMHNVSVLTGRAPAALAQTLSASAPVPSAPVPLSVALPAETLRQRPDVQQAESNINAAWANVAVAEAGLYPRFSISGSMGLSALTLGALGNSGALARALLASVSFPLFDGGAARGQVAVQQALLTQSRVKYEATVLAALKDVEDGLVTLQGNLQRLDKLTSAADSASRADELARQQYSAGLVDFLVVLDAQRTLFSSRSALVEANATVSADMVRLYKALGGGWRAGAPV